LSWTARTNDYDLIILDNNLPKKCGAEVCKDIREAGKSVPIILLSVESETEQKVKLLKSGADDYVTKPFSFNELLARIHTILKRPKLRTPETFEFGNISINPLTHEVKVNRKSVYLTKKEYSILELLAKHGGDVVSRGAIMEHVWDLDGNPFSNTIETHVFNLRKKIETAKNRVIWSVPGRGYRISVS
jgi:DNA-binding response OmpR family regulator